MDKITGRSDDLIILRGVNVFPSQIEEHILKIDGISPHYQIELSKSGPLDVMKVRVEAAPSNEDPDRRGTLAAQLAENIKQNVGISAEIDVTPVGKVDRSVGKAVRIIDRRND
jgi:phenylacetate-CoA ligase